MAGWCGVPMKSAYLWWDCLLCGCPWCGCVVWLCGRLAEWRCEDSGVAGWWSVETGLWSSGLVAALDFSGFVVWIDFSFLAWLCS